MLFSLSSVANAGWILAWHHGRIIIALALATMLVLLILITRVTLRSELSARDRLLVRLPFSVYFGWVTVATIANITVWLVSIGWDGFGVSEPAWAVLIIGVGAVIGATVILSDRDMAHGLVLIWAYGGIWVKHSSADGFAGAYPTGIGSTIAGIVLLVAAILLVLLRRRTVR